MATKRKPAQTPRALPQCVQILMGLLAVLLLIAGVPLIINECYKKGGYVTIWGAPDVLSYYGTLLGAFTTVSVLAATILFTRRQLQRQRFLERSRAKWEKADLTITQALIDISPLNMCNKRKLDTKDSTFANICGIIYDLQAYSAQAKTSLDMIKCYINPAEYRQISNYIQKIDDAIKQFLKIENELENQYMSLQAIGVVKNGEIPNSVLIASLATISEIVKQIPTAHNGPYQELLNMKREVFEAIYADIDAQADRMLEFGKTK